MRSIRLNLLLTMLLLALLPAGLIVSWNLTRVKSSLVESKHNELRSFSREVARHIRNTMNAAASNLDFIASNQTLADPKVSKEQREEEFERLKKHFPLYSSLELLDADGYPYETSESSSLMEMDRTEWFKTAKTTGLRVVSRPELNLKAYKNGKEKGTIDLTFAVYQPVVNSSAGVQAVVRASVSLAPIWTVLKEAKVGRTGTCVLLDEMGIVLFHPDENQILRNYSKMSGIDFNTVTDGQYRGIDGTEYLFDVEQMTRNETFTGRAWTLICRLRVDEAFQMTHDYQKTSYIVGAITIAAALIVGTFQARRISRPIVNAAKAARLVAMGNYTTKLHADGLVELEELSEAFNLMTYQILHHNEHLELLVDSRTRKLAESERHLSALTAQLRASYEATQDGILVLREDGEVIAANGRLEEFFGLTAGEIHAPSVQLLRRRLGGKFADPDAFEEAWRRFESSPDQSAEFEWSLTNPRERVLHVYAAPVMGEDGVLARLWAFRDITEQRNLENSLRQAQKMEAIGRLAGGIAHDFNNLLQGILGNLKIVAESPSVEQNEDVQSRLSAARTASLRAAELVRGMLGFSRQTHLKLSRCDANKVLKEIKNLVQPGIDPRIEISLKLEPNLWGLHADITQINQVVMNMLLNAKDAMPEGGHLVMSTGNVILTAEEAGQVPGARPGEYVRITISDDGSGMSPEIRAKIFEPFFTTKDPGKGTGLGLATSFGIVQQHGGWITCASVPGVGTTFDVFLPRNEVDGADSAPPPQKPKAKGGRETILVVDDEAVVRSVAEAVLKRLGYNVLTATDGEDALEKLGRHDGVIDLVLMDMTMPRLSGKDTFRAMRRGVARDVPVIICSGYLVEMATFGDGVGSVPDGFLQKPYDVDDMAEVVRDVLDSSASRKLAAR